MRDDRKPVVPAHGRGIVAPDLSGSYAELRKLNLFDGIPNDDLFAAIADGGIERVVVARDVIVADADRVATEGGRVCLVVSGQVAVAAFDRGELAARRAEQLRLEAMSDQERKDLSILPPAPLARVARKNLAGFLDGDLFNTAALARPLEHAVAFFTVSPTVLAVLSPHQAGQLAARFGFFQDRLRRAIELSRERLRNVAGVKQEIFDFWVRQGISVAGQTVRVRQLDLCIDCKLCEEACEDRYGARRLTLGGYQLGMVDFVYTCRTCSDQRCIDPCEYDSIRFDRARAEVVINEATCTGCTACAQACPFGAIEMVEIEDPSHPAFSAGFKLRLDGAGALGFGTGTPRLARPRRIANKCDHCATYADQACVSACPTGSLIEIAPADVFRERSPVAVALARAGYDRDAAPGPPLELLPTDPFVHGLGVKSAGAARVRRLRVNSAVSWGIGLAAWFLALLEILLRVYRPTASLQYYLLRKEGLEPAIAALKVGYRAGSELAVWCGYTGTALLLVAIIYPMFRRIRGFHRLARNAFWFDFHMMAGTVGPMFILLHTALKLDNWVSLAFWSMVMVGLSGVMGRYLYTKVPDLYSGRELEELDHQRALARLRRDSPDAAALAEAEILAHRRRAERVAERVGLVGALWWIVAQDLARPFAHVRRRLRLRRAAATRAAARELAERTGRLLLIERRRVIAPRAQLVLHAWKWVHVPFAMLMAVVASVHIWKAFIYSM